MVIDEIAIIIRQSQKRMPRERRIKKKRSYMKIHMGHIFVTIPSHSSVIHLYPWSFKFDMSIILHITMEKNPFKFK